MKPTYLLLLLFLLSCNPSMKLAKLEIKHPDLFQLHNSDSTKTIIKEHTHDSTVFVKLPAETYTVTIPCPDYTPPQGAKLNYKVKNKVLTVICPADSLKARISIQDDTIIKLRTINKSGMATVTKTIVAPPTGLQEFYKYFSWLIIFGAGVFGGIKAFK